jgi:hypothetical protein
MRIISLDVIHNTEIIGIIGESTKDRASDLPSAFTNRANEIKQVKK